MGDQGGPQERVSSPTHGTLDLDHICAEVPEDHGGEWTRENPGEVGHPDPIESAGGN